MSRMHAPEDHRANADPEVAGPSPGDCPFCGEPYNTNLARHLDEECSVHA